MPDYVRLSTMTAAYPFMGTYAPDYMDAIRHMDAIRKSKAEYEAEKRAEIYAKADALRAKKGFPY